MSDRSNLRLLVLGALLFSLILTMLGRLFFLQVVSADVYNQIGAHNSVRDVITPATRGLILDQAGRPLVNNRTSLVVSLDRAELESQQDEGVAVLKRLAGPLHTTYEALFERIQLCGTKYAVSGSCWNGSPFQPIPVAKDVSTALALSIMERRADFPGVMAQLESVREYPEIDGVNAAHMLGYLGAVSQGELTAQQQALDAGKIDAAQATLTGTDLVGRSGLEAQYDDQLRGKAGVKALSVDISANVIGTASETDPTPGDYVVTNVDARLQAVVEKQLLAAVKRARSTTQPGTGRKYKADSAAAVVLDVTNGHVLAMASYPSYDPKVWVGGISTKEYTKLTAKKSNFPLISRATQGVFAPASTFKIATTSAALMNGYSMNQTYSCPSRITAGGRIFNNNEGEAHGNITFKRAIELSCDTIYYGVAKHFWEQDGGLSATHDDAIAKMAKAYGMGRKTGIDLPSESGGDIGGWQYREDLTSRYQADWCANKDDPRYSAQVRQIYADNCQYGYRYQVGDAANLAIGQGDTAITPLQLAQAYAALANGGTVYQPQVGEGDHVAAGQGREGAQTGEDRQAAGLAQRAGLPAQCLQGHHDQRHRRWCVHRVPPRQDRRDRHQDRNRPGDGQAVDVLVRVVRTGRPAEVRGRDDGVAGRLRRHHVGAERTQDLRIHLRGQGRIGRPGTLGARRRRTRDEAAGDRRRRHTDLPEGSDGHRRDYGRGRFPRHRPRTAVRRRRPRRHPGLRCRSRGAVRCRAHAAGPPQQASYPAAASIGCAGPCWATHRPTRATARGGP